MSRSKHGSKGPGHEYWASRLYPGGEPPGRDTKQRTARKERRESKAMEQDWDLTYEDEIEAWDELSDEALHLIELDDEDFDESVYGGAFDFLKDEPDLYEDE